MGAGGVSGTGLGAGLSDRLERSPPEWEGDTTLRLTDNKILPPDNLVHGAVPVPGVGGAADGAGVEGVGIGPVDLGP